MSPNPRRTHGVSERCASIGIFSNTASLVFIPLVLFSVRGRADELSRQPGGGAVSTMVHRFSRSFSLGRWKSLITTSRVRWW